TKSKSDVMQLGFTYQSRLCTRHQGSNFRVAGSRLTPWSARRPAEAYQKRRIVFIALSAPAPSPRPDRRPARGLTTRANLVHRPGGAGILAMPALRIQGALGSTRTTGCLRK